MDARPAIHGTTAMFPAVQVHEAVRRLVAGVAEPLYGAVSSSQMQLCPQSFGTLSEGVCERLREDYPAVAFRLHANSRVEAKHRLLDASTVSDETWSYYAALADRSRRLGARAYSLHAGEATHASLDQVLDHRARLQDLFGPDCVVALEGLYPHAKRPHLLSSWADYERVLAAGVPLALDLSHLNIVARHERTIAGGLLRALVASPHTVELHISSNDGVRDEHARLDTAPYWWDELAHVGPNAVVFTESNLTKPRSAL